MENTKEWNPNFSREVKESFIDSMQVFVKIYCELGTLHCLVCQMSNIFYLAAFSSQNLENFFLNKRFLYLIRKKRKNFGRFLFSKPGENFVFKRGNWKMFNFIFLLALTVALHITMQPNVVFSISTQPNAASQSFLQIAYVLQFQFK